MYDKVIKAYLGTVDANLRIPYMEKDTVVDEVKIIASVYKNTRTKEFYCLATIVDKGEYLFEDMSTYSRYYNSEVVMSCDVAQETLTQIKQQFFVRKRLLSFISNNPNLPNILTAAYNKNLIVYYLKAGRFRVARLNNGQLVLDLPAPEQVYLSDLLNEFGIRVRRSQEEEFNPYGLL